MGYMGFSVKIGRCSLVTKGYASRVAMYAIAYVMEPPSTALLFWVLFLLRTPQRVEGCLFIKWKELFQELNGSLDQTGTGQLKLLWSSKDSVEENLSTLGKLWPKHWSAKSVQGLQFGSREHLLWTGQCSDLNNHYPWLNVGFQGKGQIWGPKSVHSCIDVFFWEGGFDKIKSVWRQRDHLKRKG